jgi:hypothetical protein
MNSNTELAELVAVASAGYYKEWNDTFDVLVTRTGGSSALVAEPQT